MIRCFFVLGVFGLIWQVSGYNKYENYTLMRIFPQTESKLQDVVKFEDPKGEVEILKGSRGVNDSMDVLVPEHRMGFMHEFISAYNITYDKQENYGRTFIEVDQISSLRRDLTLYSLFEYNSASKIKDYITSLAKDYPNLVTLAHRGKSFEGREITLVKISANPNAGNPIIFIDAGIHAREWVAPAMALYLIHRLTTDTEAMKNELNGVDWYILPLVNPDGYEYSRSSTKFRLWRKTRSKRGTCYGVDGNRNYDFKWGVIGSSDDCHSQTYQGPEPFSEPETRIVRDIMKDNAKRIKLYVSLHSYGQYLVYPWGYTRETLPPEWKRMNSLARKVSDAVVRSGGKAFRVMSAGQWYPAAGGSDDYAFGAVGVPYSYTMELTTGYQFNFPNNLLDKVLPTFYEGFSEFGRNIKSEFRR